jgi:hypothetical protein
MGAWGAQPTTPAAAPNKPVRPETVQVGYLLNFANFGTWPGEPEAFTIGIVGQDPFGSDIDTLAAKYKVKKSVPIRVKRFDSAATTEPCEILVVADPTHLSEVTRRMSGKPVLIVTRGEGLASQGSMINFYLVENAGSTNVKFEINVRRIESANIRLDARVIRLGKLVEDAPIETKTPTPDAP